MQYENPNFRTNTNLKRILLNLTSPLYQKLCNPNGSGDCQVQPQIVLDTNLECSGLECDLDNLRIVMVLENTTYYEYLRPACGTLFYYFINESSINIMLHHILNFISAYLPLLVELAFSQEAQLTKIVDHRFNAMCLQKEITDVAMASCCPRIQDTWIPSTCEFSMERVSYELSEERCSNYSDGAVMCDWQVSARE